MLSFYVYSGFREACIGKKKPEKFVFHLKWLAVQSLFRTREFSMSWKNIKFTNNLFFALKYHNKHIKIATCTV